MANALRFHEAGVKIGLVSELPSGTVSLLFTDVEGSTQLQQNLGERYHEVVAEHRRLLEEAFGEHGGIVVDRQTESFFVVFTRARYAVQGAAAAQRALAEHHWPDGIQVKVRMGIHSGDPEVAGDRYVGLAVARAARICASAHGSQVLLSSSTRALLSDVQRSSLRALGVYRLKDFIEPEQISQLVIDGLPSQFPPLRTQAAPSRRKRWIIAVTTLLLAGAIAGAVIAFTSSDSGSVEVGSTSLALIDPMSNEVTDAIELGFKSSLIAAGEGYVWVVDPQGSTLWRIDPRTRAMRVLPLAVGAGDVPFGLAVGRGSIWVAVLRGKEELVLELSPDVGDRRREVHYGGTPEALALVQYSPLAVGAGAVWAIDPVEGGVWRVAPGRARKLAEGLDARSLAAGSGAVWVAGSSGVEKLDAVTGIELAPPSISSERSGETASVALGRNAVWFVSSSERRLFEIDPQRATTTQTFPVGRGPSGVAVGEGAVWVANSRDGTVSRLDLGDDEPKTIRLGPPPGGVVAAYGTVWVSSGEPRS